MAAVCRSSRLLTTVNNRYTDVIGYADLMVREDEESLKIGGADLSRP